MAVKAGECDMGLAVGVEKLAGAGLLGGAGGPRRTSNICEPKGRYGAVATVDGRIGTETMPGVFAQIGMEYGHKYGGTSFELFAKISEKNHAHSTLNPLAAYTKRMTPRADHGRRHDRLPQHPAHVLGQLRRRGRRGGGVAAPSSRRSLPEQQRRAVKVSASILTTDPWEEACQVLPNVNTLTRNAAEQAYEQAGVGPEDLDLVELHDCFATAELVHYDNLMLCQPGEAGRLLRVRRDLAGRQDPGQRVRRPAVEGPSHRRHRHRQHLGGLPPPAGRGRRPPDRGRQGRPGPRHRPRLGLRRPHPGERSAA